MNSSIKHIHFIAICGVGMSAVATALWKRGYKVTGSDSGFFPPISTHITNLGIPYYPGFHVEKMLAMGKPDLVVVGNAVSTTNPEFVYIKENNIPFKSFPEMIGEYISKENSIVVAGTYGKTTSTALLTHILKHAGLSPSYMIGGLSQDNNPAAEINDSEWSVLEGDEYSTSKWDRRAKFMHYKPTHLMLTAVKWDHADIYPTEQSYFDAFSSLLALLPSHGKIVYCKDQHFLTQFLAQNNKTTEDIITYGKDEGSTYRYQSVTQNEKGLEFEIVYHGKSYTIKSPMLGGYNAENITGCFAMAHSIGITPGDISDAIATFQGMKRRLEKRYENKVTIIDDIAHSPEKARSILTTLRSIYKGKITVIYEPNIGNRTPQSKPAYNNAFVSADEVIIPRLSKLKVDSENPEKTFDGEELANTIRNTQSNTLYIEDDNELVKHITENQNEGDVIAFLGSHGFRGMIEETIKKIALG